MVGVVVRFIGHTLALTFTGFIFLLISVGLLPENRQPIGFSLGFMILSVILIYGSPVIAGFWFWRQKQKRAATETALNAQIVQQDLLRRRFFERNRLIEAVDEHRAALTRNLSRAVKKNDYGAVIHDNRSTALFEFLASVSLDADLIDLEEAIELVSEQLAFYEAHEKDAGFDPNTLPFDGHAFESWVANALNGFGWDAIVTVASGDQGIDVIARRDGQRLGIQCKLYGSAVGNKAVQEAHAGRHYHGLDKLAVLSNAQFSRSAKDLADATGVILCSHHDIPRLYEKVFGTAIKT